MNPTTAPSTAASPSGAVSRRDFLQRASLLPFCAAAGAGLAAATAPRASAAETIRRAGPPRLKLSLNAYSFSQMLYDGRDGKPGGMTLMELLEFCAEHGFDGLDPTGYFFPGYPQIPDEAYLNQFKRRAFHLGIDISGTGVRNNFAAPDPAVRAADVRHTKEWIEVAARLGAPVLRVFAGAVPKGYENNWDEPAGWIVECLQECLPHAEKHGVILGLQNHGDMVKTADEALKILARLPSSWIGVIVDTGSFHTTDPYDDIARVMPYAVNWQIKETLFNKESGVRTDLKKLMRIIRDGGYRGYIPIETLSISGRPYQPRELVPQFLGEIRAAIEATS